MAEASPGGRKLWVTDRMTAPGIIAPPEWLWRGKRVCQTVLLLHCDKGINYELRDLMKMSSL